MLLETWGKCPGWQVAHGANIGRMACDPSYHKVWLVISTPMPDQEAVRQAGLPEHPTQWGVRDLFRAVEAGVVREGEMEIVTAEVESV